MFLIGVLGESIPILPLSLLGSNIALNQPSGQTDEYDYDADGAFNALDGNPATCQHTHGNGQVNKWWYVKIPRCHNIYQIRIITRRPFQDRSDQLIISVQEKIPDLNDASTWPSRLWNRMDICYITSGNHDAHMFICDTTGRDGEYLMVQSRKDDACCGAQPGK